MRRWALAVLFCAGTAAGAWAQVPISGGKATLKELVNSDTLVTVVLNIGGAEDRNVRVVDVGSDYISVLAPNGNRNSYLLSNVKELRIQKGEVDSPGLRVNVGRMLNENEQAIVANSVEQLAKVYDNAAGNQKAKMLAAALLAASSNLGSNVLNAARDPNGDLKKKAEEAHKYLSDLAAANDDAVALEAAYCLFVAGDVELAAKSVHRGLVSANRKTRATAAELAGLVNDTSAQTELLAMARERSADLSAPAAYALAKMGNREVLPILLAMIDDLNEEKGQAAAEGLVALGGKEVIEQVRTLVEKAENTPRFRMALVLYALKDPMGEDLLRREFLQVPSLSRNAALALARAGHPDGLNFLRKKLDERFDVTEENYIFRARAAAALIKGGDRSGIPKLQEALRVEMPRVQGTTCAIIGEAGERFLLPVVMPALESSHPGVVLLASMAAMSIADPELHDRIADPNSLEYDSVKLRLAPQEL